GRPEMKRRRGNLEGKSDERHHDAGSHRRCDRSGGYFLANGAEPGGLAHAVDKAQPKEGERTRGTAEEKILEASLRGALVRLVEPRHHVERQSGEFEPDENHEQLLAPHEEQESNGGEQKEREIFTAMPGRAATARQD